MSNWQIALSTVAAALKTDQVPWLVVGSVASAVQRCDFEPRDLDLLAPDYPSLALLGRQIDAKLQAEEQTPIQSQEFPGGFKWHKLYWTLNDFQIDASFIESGGGIPDSENGDGVWEGGPLIWKYVEYVTFADYLVPVPPLCVQLESQLRREQLDRAEEIRRVMQARGYDQEVARRCMSAKHLAYLAA